MTRCFVLSFLAALCSSAGLQAQGFLWNTAGARAMSLGGSYVPSDSGVVDALAVNPAGLSTLEGPTLDLSVAGVFAGGTFSNSVNRNVSLHDAPGVVPDGAFGMPIGKSRFSFGVGEVPVLTSVANWNYVDAPGVAGASYGQQRQKSAILATNSVAGLGIYLGPALSIGVSVGTVYNSNTLDAPYVFQSQPVVKGLKTLLDLNTSGFGWNSGAGVLFRPSRKFEIQAAWNSDTKVDSSGSASGNIGQQLKALGLVAQPAFHYAAMVHNILPQSVMAGISWQFDARWMVVAQADWVNWKRAFKTLPVALTNGSNPDINGLLQSTSLNDAVPLDWKNQVSVHAGFERKVLESFSLRGGYAHANSPVPGSTLSPLTAAILSNQLTAGVGYRLGRERLDLAYAFDPTATGRVGESALLSGEYSNSIVRIRTQTLLLTTEFRF
jgi:long-subunit fatty acid transport protein